MLINPPGGNYNDARVADYITSSNAPLTANLWYVITLTGFTLSAVAPTFAAFRLVQRWPHWPPLPVP